MVEMVGWVEAAITVNLPELLDCSDRNRLSYEAPQHIKDVPQGDSGRQA